MAVGRDGLAYMGKELHIPGGVRRDLFAQLRKEHRSSSRTSIAQLCQVVWGLPQTVVGMALFFALRRKRHARYRSAVITEWALDSGLCLGLFIFIPRDCPRSLLVHEYGHTLQSLLLGPLYLPLVVLPSILWAGLPQAKRLREDRAISYYRFPTERSANRLTKRVTGETPIGWYENK